MHVHGGDIYGIDMGTGVVDFSTNINPLGMPEAVFQAAVEGVSLSTRYPDVRMRKLKRAIAVMEKLDTADGDCDGQIICGNGAAELIFSLVYTLRPQQALLVSPTFAEYEEALTAGGCQIHYYELQEKDGFVMGRDYLERLTEELDLVFLCNPNNPVGNLIPFDMMERIVRKCRDLEIFLVVDECFLNFVERPENYSMKGKLQNYPHLFILKAFTKMYAMAGLRLGYGLCSNARILKQMRAHIQPWNVSIPAQMAGIAAAGEGDFVRRTRILIAAERQYLRQELTALGMKVYEAQANYIFFASDLPELRMRCLSAGVLLRDCQNYRSLGPGFYRIAVRSHQENVLLMQILQRIREDEC